MAGQAASLALPPTVLQRAVHSLKQKNSLRDRLTSRKWFYKEEYSSIEVEKNLGGGEHNGIIYDY